MLQIWSFRTIYSYRHTLVIPQYCNKGTVPSVKFQYRSTLVHGLIASSLSAHAVGQSGCFGSSDYVRLETNDLAGHCKVTTHTTTTAGPSSPVISNVPECSNQPMHFLNGNLDASNSETFWKIVKSFFQNQWFEKWQWLATLRWSTRFSFCHVCTTARKTVGKVTNTGTDVDMAFIERDFSNW